MFDFDIQRMLLTIPGILIGLSFHEFAHAFASDRLGDPTPRSQGRLTLSPRAHIDILGFLFILFARFGWAKPVQVNPRYYKNPGRDEIIVSLAGPAMNFVVAVFFTILMKISLVFDLYSLMGETAFSILLTLFGYTIWINIMLLVFNLIPIPPLDGYHVIANFVPYRYRDALFKIEQYSMFILIIFVLSPLSRIVIGKPVEFIYNFLYSLFRI
ncbi:MAG: site-2 protease family protein [Clostridia bacterium]|nr:site-2 protease family protein [Clostridia bacterium]